MTISEKEFNESEINTIAEEILAYLNENKSLTEATLLTMSGDLGAGKTALSAAIARALGVIGHVISPTFLIQKKYNLHNSHLKNWKNLIHIDAYRLDNSSELTNLGWQEFLNDPENLIILEWPERVSEILPDSHHKIHLEHTPNNTRIINAIL